MEGKIISVAIKWQQWNANQKANIYKKWIHLPKILHLNSTSDTIFELNKISWREGGSQERKGVSLHDAPDYSRFVNSTEKIFTFWIKNIIINRHKICDDMWMFPTMAKAQFM